MRHDNPARNKGTAQEPGESPNNQRPTLYVCRAADDCYATFGSPEARSDHEASDHNGGGA